jgi:hypothetical protein
LEHQDFLPNLECWWKENPNIFNKNVPVSTEVKTCLTNVSESGIKKFLGTSLRRKRN